MLLIGEYQHTLDAKGRVNFPAKLREELGERFILTRGLDNCLFVYPMEQWRIMEEKINAQPVSKIRNVQRFFFGGAVELEPDKQGRVVIPANLRKYAGLEKEIAIVGVSERVEIWDAEVWNREDAEISAESVAETMMELDF